MSTRRVAFPILVQVAIHELARDPYLCQDASLPHTNQTRMTPTLPNLLFPCQHCEHSGQYDRKRKLPHLVLHAALSCGPDALAGRGVGWACVPTQTHQSRDAPTYNMHPHSCSEMCSTSPPTTMEPSRQQPPPHPCADSQNRAAHTPASHGGNLRLQVTGGNLQFHTIQHMENTLRRKIAGDT